MKFVRIVLIVYCCLIGGVCLLDTVADPNGQPLKNIATIAAMGATLFGIFGKRREFILAIPAYAVFFIAFAAARNPNISSAIGQCAGVVFPVTLAALQYRNMKPEVGPLPI